MLHPRRLRCPRRRPGPGAVMEQQEVDDLADDDAVPQVAERTAQDQGESGAQHAAAPALQHPRQEHAGDDGDQCEQPARPIGRTGQEAEGHARIVGEYEAHEGGDRQRFTGGEGRHDEHFGEPVGDDHQYGEPQPFQSAGVFGGHRLHSTQTRAGHRRRTDWRRSARTTSDARNRRRHRRANASTVRTSGAGLA